MISSVVTGNLTRDIETKTTESGTKLYKFGVASNKGNSTTFVNCTAFGKTGETLAKFLGKGSFVVVSGDMELREYSTQSGDGKSLDLIVRDFALGPKVERGEQSAATAEPAGDDIPF